MRKRWGSSLAVWLTVAFASHGQGQSIAELDNAGKTLARHIAQQDATIARLTALASDTGERGVGDAMVDALLAVWDDPHNQWHPRAERVRAGLAAALRAQPAGGGEDWQARALSAEADIERMTDAFNRENGPTFMGEPVLPPEKMVELEPGVRVPKWLLDDTRRVELYMKAHLPGPWRIGGIQSHDYANATPPESGGQGVARVLRDFFFDAANQQHIPTLTVEFEPVKVGVPTNEAKGFQDRDRLAATLAQGGGNER